MATAAKRGFQDMPPPGGYDPIQTVRVPVKTFFTAKRTVAAWAFCTAIGGFAYIFNYYEFQREKLEMKSAKFAMTPLLLAESDRAYLKGVRKNREYERELMKDFPDWKVGTYFGEPIYKTVPKDAFIKQRFVEYHIHGSLYPIQERVSRRHWV